MLQIKDERRKRRREGKGERIAIACTCSRTHDLTGTTKPNLFHHPGIHLLVLLRELKLIRGSAFLHTNLHTSSSLSTINNIPIDLASFIKSSSACCSPP